MNVEQGIYKGDEAKEPENKANHRSSAEHGFTSTRVFTEHVFTDLVFPVNDIDLYFWLVGNPNKRAYNEPRVRFSIL